MALSFPSSPSVGRPQRKTGGSDYGGVGAVVIQFFYDITHVVRHSLFT